MTAMLRERLGPIRRGIAAAAFLLIFAGTFQPLYLRVFGADRPAAAAWLTELPYSKTPGLRPFLVQARARTAPDDVVVFLAPFTAWEGGYRYAIRGARYTLAGRTVRGVIGPGDVDLSANLEGADVVVAWRTPPPPGWTVVWRGDDGVIARRAR